MYPVACTVRSARLLVSILDPSQSCPSSENYVQQDLIEGQADQSAMASAQRLVMALSIRIMPKRCTPSTRHDEVDALGVMNETLGLRTSSDRLRRSCPIPRGRKGKEWKDGQCNGGSAWHAQTSRARSRTMESAKGKSVT